MASIRRVGAPTWNDERGAVGWLLVGIILGIALVIWLIVVLFRAIF
ncbi:MAG: hypothetical protein M3245_02755 [Actinomycetota bacterium]|nr:hypothetical protein [Actinomycetota bacterium]